MHPKKVDVSSIFTFGGIVMLIRDEQPSNAAGPMEFTDCGMVRDISDVHP